MVNASQNQNTNLADLKVESNKNSVAKNIVTVLPIITMKGTAIIVEKANTTTMKNTKNSYQNLNKSFPKQKLKWKN